MRIAALALVALWLMGLDYGLLAVGWIALAMFWVSSYGYPRAR